MTTTVDAPTSRRRTTPPPPRREGARARWLVAGRLARRQLRRTLLSSVLIGVLIMLPIAAMTAYTIVATSTIGTAAERVRVELGRTEAWIAVRGLPDSGFWQAPAEPEWNGYPSSATAAPEGTPIDDPTGLLPAGTETIRVVGADVRVRTADGIAGMAALSGDLWDPRFEGRYERIEGRTPTGSREVMATPATLDRLGVGIGDEIVLSDDGSTYTVVGTLAAADLSDRAPALFLPASADLEGDVRWYLPERSLSWPEIEALNESGVVAFSRPVVLDPPVVDSAQIQGSYDRNSGAMMTVVMVLAAAGIFAAYVVVMLAGAAFAVAARRQQHTLAIAASVGASSGDLRRVILLQGTSLGLAGGLVGVALGVGAAALTMALVSDGSATQFWGFHVPWPLLGAILLFSTLVGTISAAMPARTIARSDTLGALRGARRPQTPRASRPVWGSLLLLFGIALTIGSAFAVLAVNINSLSIPGDSPLRVIAPMGIVIGPIIFQLGIPLSGRWLLGITSTALARCGLAARLAARDAAANASRTVPAFAAIAATVFIAVFAIGQISMQNAQTARQWSYQAPVGTLALDLHAPDFTAGLDRDQATEAVDGALELADVAGATSTAVISKQEEIWTYESTDDIPEDLTRVIAVLPEEHLQNPELEPSFLGNGRNPSNPITVIAADEIGAALGIELTPSQLAAYRTGTALVLDPRFITAGTISLGEWNARDVSEGKMPDNIWTHWPQAPPRVEPNRQEDLDVIAIDLPHQPLSVVLSPETADELGIVAQPSLVIAAFDAPASTEVRDRVQAQTGAFSGADWAVSARFEDGPPDDAFWMVPILGAVTVLVLGASGVALSLARFERRPDDATLSAVGATAALRRRIGFWQGLIIAGFGTIAGAAAGVLPPIGFAIQSWGALQMDDIPWLALGALVVALPLAIALVSWSVPPRRAELTRRTAIA
ncbi:FtsX-like permease family protein [Microbacterium sp. MYb62]|uniref:ABC transporter permease n=1 Tax=Microbacterium sp. MYb62 TaxID=1848690 RepID=UPI000CFC8C63|nr:FtsX-like permease family protein [Microbacterium sp. MYb62]PRB19268.1 ABC transporter permease [Microbacterium sp. MYb62]